MDGEFLFCMLVYLWNLARTSDHTLSAMIFAMPRNGILLNMERTDESVTAPGVQGCSDVHVEAISPRRERILNFIGLPFSNPSMCQRVSGSIFSDCQFASDAYFHSISYPVTMPSGGASQTRSMALEDGLARNAVGGVSGAFASNAARCFSEAINRSTSPIVTAFISGNAEWMITPGA